MEIHLSIFSGPNVNNIVMMSLLNDDFPTGLLLNVLIQIGAKLFLKQEEWNRFLCGGFKNLLTLFRLNICNGLDLL